MSRQYCYPIIGNTWGAPDEKEGQEHYWIRSRGSNHWRSLCSMHRLDHIEEWWGVYYLALWAEQDREKADVCEKCRKSFALLDVAKVIGEVAPKPYRHKIQEQN
jgi:hypothetical protein